MRLLPLPQISFPYSLFPVEGAFLCLHLLNTHSVGHFKSEVSQSRGLHRPRSESQLCHLITSPVALVEPLLLSEPQSPGCQSSVVQYTGAQHQERGTGLRGCQRGPRGEDASGVGGRRAGLRDRLRRRSL